MSLHEYRTSLEIQRQDYPFYALIMAAMRKADSYNMVKLKFAFPAVHGELDRRYNAGEGILKGDLSIRARIKVKGCLVDRMEGHMGEFSGITGTFFIPDETGKVLFVSDRSRLDILVGGKWRSLE